jgi:hypothetical protein
MQTHGRTGARAAEPANSCLQARCTVAAPPGEGSADFHHLLIDRSPTRSLAPSSLCLARHIRSAPNPPCRPSSWTALSPAPPPGHPAAIIDAKFIRCDDSIEKVGHNVVRHSRSKPSHTRCGVRRPDGTGVEPRATKGHTPLLLSPPAPRMLSKKIESSLRNIPVFCSIT